MQYLFVFEEKRVYYYTATAKDEEFGTVFAIKV